MTLAHAVAPWESPDGTALCVGCFATILLGLPALLVAVRSKQEFSLLGLGSILAGLFAIYGAFQQHEVGELTWVCLPPIALGLAAFYILAKKRRPTSRR